MIIWYANFSIPNSVRQSRYVYANIEGWARDANNDVVVSVRFYTDSERTDLLHERDFVLSADGLGTEPSTQALEAALLQTDEFKTLNIQ